MSRQSFRALALAGGGEDQGTKAGYRPDIYGMRAIAVVSVVLFDLDFRMVGGGFFGVNFFFVISRDRVPFDAFCSAINEHSMSRGIALEGALQAHLGIPHREPDMWRVWRQTFS